MCKCRNIQILPGQHVCKSPVQRIPPGKHYLDLADHINKASRFLGRSRSWSDLSDLSDLSDVCYVLYRDTDKRKIKSICTNSILWWICRISNGSRVEWEPSSIRTLPKKEISNRYDFETKRGGYRTSNDGSVVSSMCTILTNEKSNRCVRFWSICLVRGRTTGWKHSGKPTQRKC